MKRVEGAAFDIAMFNHDPAVETAARETGFLGFDSHPRSGSMHVDLGPKREWSERIVPRPASAPEAPPASERFRSPFIVRLRMLDVLGNKHNPLGDRQLWLLPTRCIPQPPASARSGVQRFPAEIWPPSQSRSGA